jgi:hypothetical protein
MGRSFVSSDYTASLASGGTYDCPSHTFYLRFTSSVPVSGKSPKIARHLARVEKRISEGEKLAELRQRDVFSTWAFRTPAFRVGHLLAFFQGVESDTLEALGMEKQVFVARRLNEPETFVRQLLDAAFSHWIRLLL